MAVYVCECTQLAQINWKVHVSFSGAVYRKDVCKSVTEGDFMSMLLIWM